MRILLAFYPIDDMGGIINHNEQLSAGFKDLGYHVDTAILLPRENMPRDGVAGGRGTYSPHTGLEFDQRRGYSWPRANCIPYMGKALTTARSILCSYDLIIWQVAVPTKRKENRGNQDWPDLYDIPVKQIAVIHDGNFLASYPWLEQISDHLNGLACVHHCAFNSAMQISVPSSLILNPQQIREVDIGPSQWKRRRKGFLSLQTFKAWKHVPELVAAIPYTTVEANLAGKGIDYYYLTSKDKCKWPGAWDTAISCGMNYLGVITNGQRDDMLHELTCLVDPSWSRKYSAIGGHFNRVIVDAILCGALPVVRPWGISTNVEGSGELFKSGVNCVAIPQHCGPAEYGALLSEACNMPYEEYFRIMRNATALLPMFDRVEVAKKFLRLAHGDYEQFGETSAQVEADSIKVFWEFFREQRNA